MGNFRRQCSFCDQIGICSFLQKYTVQTKEEGNSTFFVTTSVSVLFFPGLAQQKVHKGHCYEIGSHFMSLSQFREGRRTILSICKCNSIGISSSAISFFYRRAYLRYFESTFLSCWPDKGWYFWHLWRWTCLATVNLALSVYWLLMIDKGCDPKTEDN